MASPAALVPSNPSINYTPPRNQIELDCASGDKKHHPGTRYHQPVHRDDDIRIFVYAYVNGDNRPTLREQSAVEKCIDAFVIREEILVCIHGFTSFSVA